MCVCVCVSVWLCDNCTLLLLPRRVLRSLADTFHTNRLDDSFRLFALLGVAVAAIITGVTFAVMGTSPTSSGGNPSSSANTAFALDCDRSIGPTVGQMAAAPEDAGVCELDFLCQPFASVQKMQSFEVIISSGNSLRLCMPL